MCAVSRVLVVATVVGCWACGNVTAAPDAAPDTAPIADAPGTVDGPPDDAQPPSDAPPPPLPRATADRADEAVGYQVQVMYVLASDGVDRNLDTSGALTTSAAAWSQWIARKAPGPRLRLDTFQGQPDIMFVRLTKTGAELAAAAAFIRDRIEDDLKAAGLIRPNKLYAVYYDGDATTCGGAPVPPGLVGHVVALYLDGHQDGFACRDNPLASSASVTGYFELSMIRGLFHALGAVARCAPNFTAGDAVGDYPTDIMYSGSALWAPSEIDVGRNDYWGHSIVDCVNLARSAFLDPLPVNSELPPGWQP